MPNVNRTQKVFSIDSSQKLNSNETGSNFTVKLSVPQRNAFNKASCLTCEMPKTYWMIDDDNDSFTLLEATGGAAVSVEIPQGTYTITEFLAQMKIELDDASPNSEVYTLTIDSKTSLVRITNATGLFSLTLNESFQKYLGMPASFGPSASYRGSNVVNLQRHDVLYVKCNQISNANDNVLVELYPSNVPYNNIIQYNAPDTYTNSVTMNDNTSQIFQFTVEDKNGNIVDFNGGKLRLIMSCWNEM